MIKIGTSMLITKKSLNDIHYFTFSENTRDGCLRFAGSVIDGCSYEELFNIITVNLEDKQNFLVYEKAEVDHTLETVIVNNLRDVERVVFEKWEDSWGVSFIHSDNEGYFGNGYFGFESKRDATDFYNAISKKLDELA